MPVVVHEEVQEEIKKNGWTIENLWPTLSVSQKKFVIEAQGLESIAEAARNVGLVPQTVYNWGWKVKAAVHLFADQAAHVALMELEDAVIEAAQVKVQEIREPGSTKRSQQDAASEVLDRVLGRPIQSSQVALKGEVSHTAPTFYLPQNGREGEE